MNYKESKLTLAPFVSPLLISVAICFYFCPPFSFCPCIRLFFFFSSPELQGRLLLQKLGCSQAQVLYSTVESNFSHETCLVVSSCHKVGLIVHHITFEYLSLSLHSFWLWMCESKWFSFFLSTLCSRVIKYMTILHYVFVECIYLDALILQTVYKCQTQPSDLKKSLMWTLFSVPSRGQLL